MIKNKNISLCTVIANSDDCLERYFKWVLPRFEEIIILRSDSIDKTDEILDKYATAYPKQISLQHQKIENIADQKQCCVNLATKDWKLIIDADEIITDYQFDVVTDLFNKSGIDLAYIPRYNLQKDNKNYNKKGYPDPQPRLFNSNVKFSMNEEHLVHHQMNGPRKSLFLDKAHIIHWGQIRSKEQQQWKSNMRKEFANGDQWDGKGLKEHDNWFWERNKKYDQDAVALPDNIIKFIGEFE